MKRLLFIFILTFCSGSLTKADDIRDFEMEGMSVGDSLLVFFNEKKINKFFNYDDLPSDMKFRIAEFYPSEMKMNTYDAIQIFYKPEDKKYILHTISGIVDCSNVSKIDCKKIFEEIKDDLKITFKNIDPKVKKSRHFDDKSGDSIVLRSSFNLANGIISVSYTNWSEKMNYSDNVMVSVNSTESVKWLNNNYGAN